MDDYLIASELNIKNKYNDKLIVVYCNICGHTKIVTKKNFLKQNRNHSQLNCHKTWYIKLIGEIFGDYKVINYNYNKIILQCIKCGHIKEVNQEDFKYQSFLHSAHTCNEDFYKYMIGSSFGDYIIIDFFKHNKIIKFVLKCRICNQIIYRTLQELNRRKIINHGTDCIKAIPNSIYKKIILQRYWSIYARCNNKNSSNYSEYGGRGIQLKYKYAVDFYLDYIDEFIKFSKTHGINNSTFDRINVNGNYEKGNIRLATQSIQSTNTRRKKFFIISCNNEKIIGDNTSTITKYIGSTSSAVGNLIRGSSKTCCGWKLEKVFDNNITTNQQLQKIISNENVTTNLVMTI